MIVQNKAIKEALKGRWKELDIKNAVIIKDANERYPDMKITHDRLSKWLGGKKGGLSESQLVFLCVRWHVPISFNIGEPVLKEGILNFVIPKYDELAALKLLKIVFPKKK